MKSDAAVLLKRLKLPSTKAFRLEQLEANHSQTYYLRFAEDSELSNGRWSASRISEEFERLRSLERLGKLLSIERCYCTIAGGASLIKKGFVYTEFVEGHSNALLRRGCCGARIIHDGDESHSMKVFQRWRAEQTDTGYNYIPCVGPTNDRVEKVVEFLHCLHDLPDSNVLLEWMWTTEGFLFCDAQTRGISEFGDSAAKILPGKRPIDFYDNLRHPSAVSKTIVDCFDCENAPRPCDGTLLLCVNDALLSHYITRTIGTNVKVQLWIPATST